MFSYFFPYQSLTLLEYLLKTGDDRVLLKMKDNIYIVKALTEYRFVEKDGKDQVTRAAWLCPNHTTLSYPLKECMVGIKFTHYWHYNIHMISVL